MTETEIYCRAWLKNHAPESRVLNAFPTASDPWHRIEIETDPLGDMITRSLDETGEHVTLEILESEQ